MQTISDKIAELTIKVLVSPSAKRAFIDWQVKLNSMIAGFPGFVSLEFISPSDASKEWIIAERFSNEEALAQWTESKEYCSLRDELKQLLHMSGSVDIKETRTLANPKQEVTEVFVTRVTPGMEKAFHDWIAKVHRVEATFPGFRGVYVQSPRNDQGENWITLLQFDNVENLERWINSSERAIMLEESTPFLKSLESHRVSSSYAGWFGSLAKKGEVPPVWKQTMIILLVLFPVVMLEIRYLTPLLTNLNLSLSTFISNAISVSVLAWPLLPIAISLLGWWLSPGEHKKLQSTIVGTLLLCLLYLISIGFFWIF